MVVISKYVLTLPRLNCSFVWEMCQSSNGDDIYWKILSLCPWSFSKALYSYVDFWMGQVNSEYYKCANSKYIEIERALMDFPGILWAPQWAPIGPPRGIHEHHMGMPWVCMVVMSRLWILRQPQCAAGSDYTPQITTHMRLTSWKTSSKTLHSCRRLDGQGWQAQIGKSIKADIGP